MTESLPDTYFDTVFVLEQAPRPLPLEFAIVTAWNPMDESRTEAENLESNNSLKRLIDSIDPLAFEATGCSPDLRHREPGWAFRAELPQALDLARRFHQRALWWISNDRLNLISCRDPELLEVDRFSRRILPLPPSKP